MTKTRLGVNIDHVATIRNARGETYPDPLRAALLAQKSGADSITIHLREDRRHIRDKDLKNIKKKIKIALNLEMAPTKEMLDIAIRHKPSFVCIVPEKRREITTEGGLNVKKNVKFLKKIIEKLRLNVEAVNINVFDTQNKFIEDVFVVRAFKPLRIILELIHKKAENWKKILIFLGKTGKNELLEASKSWDIGYKQRVSVTSNDSIIIKINKLKKK